MLEFKLRNSPQKYTWHINQKLLNIPRDAEVEYVNASCDELAFISSHFENVPMISSLLINCVKVVTWRGVFAQFIIDNLNTSDF
jgi:hypothetical protein